MKTQVNFKIDSKLKIAVQKKAKKLGISLNDIVSNSFREFSRTNELDIRPIYYMSPKLEKSIKKTMREYERGDYLGPFTNARDAIKALNKK